MTASDSDDIPGTWLRRASSRLAAIAITVVLGLGIGAWYFLQADPEWLFERARRDPLNAERLLRKSIAAASGRYPKAEQQLCLLLAHRGKWDEAVRFYAGLDRAKCPDEFLIEFGRAALKAAHWDDARDALEEVRQRKSPGCLAALSLLSDLYFQREDGRRMLECLREQARMQPEKPELWRKLLALLRSRHLDTEYEKTLRDALEQNLPDNESRELQFNLVSYLVEKGDSAAARRELERLTKREGQTPRVKFHKAAICRMEGEPREALAILEKVAGEIGNAPAAVHLRALVHFDLGDFAAAAEGFRRELKSDPFNLTAHFKLSEAYAELGRSELARRHNEIAVEIRRKRHRINTLKELSKRHPSDAVVCEELSELYAELNDADESRVWENRALRAREHERSAP